MTTLTVGIPAYNEGNNIGKLLKQIMEQNQDSFILEKIIVISDGSSDTTIEEVKKIQDPRIELIAHTDRKGKAARFQEIINKVESDVFVQFDADTQLNGDKAISKLVEAIQKGADLVFPKVIPTTPKTYVERLSHFGFFTWQKVIAQMNPGDSLIHRCQGRCRGFSRKFYKSFSIPVEADGVEDIFSFCFALTHNLDIRYVPESEVLFRLPATRQDFLKQSRRFIKGADSLSRFYDKALVVRHMPSTKMKLIGLAKNILYYAPHITLGYLVLQFIARKTASMKDQKPVYDYVGSTKRLS